MDPSLRMQGKKENVYDSVYVLKTIFNELQKGADKSKTDHCSLIFRFVKIKKYEESYLYIVFFCFRTAYVL